MTKTQRKAARKLATELPTEIYALKFKDSEDFAPTACLIGPAMDDDGTYSFLAFRTREEAEDGRKFQLEVYGCDTEVVRLL